MALLLRNARAQILVRTAPESARALVTSQCFAGDARTREQ